MISFKNKKSKQRYFSLLPLTQLIITDVSWWANQRGLDVVITETVTTLEEDKELQRVSNSHLQGRAVDFSLIGWSEKDIKDCEKHFNEKYKEVSAYSLRTKKPVLIVPHDSGHGRHIHLQINRRFYENKRK